MTDPGTLSDLPRWRLEDLYRSPDDPAIARDLAWIAGECAGFAERFEGRLSGLTGDGLLAAIRGFEAILRCQRRVGLYAALRFRQDTLDAGRGKFLADTRTALTEATRPLVFFTLELNRLDDAALAERLGASAGLRRYRTWLGQVRNFRPHQLSAEIETYSHDLAPVQDSAWGQLFSETISGLRFDVDGDSLALEPALNLLQEGDRSRRQAAFVAVAGGMRENRRLFARITNTLLHSKQIDDRWRQFATPQASRHLANDIEAEIVAALESAVVEAYPRIAHRYYRLKARWLGLPELEAWDRNAPLPGQEERTIPWSEAREVVLSAFAGFAPEMAELAIPFFERGWIDADVTPGKAPGAFSASGPSDVHPYILLNYQGRVRDVMTLAHELGHGIHQSLAREQGDLMADAPLTFAETASVFAEMLTFHKLLERQPDPAARRALLAGKAEDMINTVVRQISFYVFESRLHEARRHGELSAAEIGRIWTGAIGESLGPSVRLGDGFENFWAYVPHFISTPFYVYAYAFGDALVNALYGLYRQGDAEFPARYLELLRAGGSLRHPELLAPFGLDLRDPAFWKIGLDLIEETIDAAESIEV